VTDRLDAWAAEFAAPEGYLNFGSYGPPARRIADETSRLLALAVEGADSGRHLHAMDARAIAAVSRLSGFDEPNIGLVPSTSLGLFQAAFGMPSGEVLVSGDEFPSNLYPWWRAQEAGRLRVRPLDGAGTHAPGRA
jgi:selenocysteine lyase/cysteine desulfurase